MRYFFGACASIVRVYVEMSLYGWFAPSKQAAKPYLPDPSKEGSEKEALKVEAADQCVERTEKKATWRVQPL